MLEALDWHEYFGPIWLLKANVRIRCVFFLSLLKNCLKKFKMPRLLNKYILVYEITLPLLQNHSVHSNLI